MNKLFTGYKLKLFSEEKENKQAKSLFVYFFLTPF